MDSDALQQVLSQTSVFSDSGKFGGLSILLTPSATPSPSSPFPLPENGTWSPYEDQLSPTSKLAPAENPGKEMNSAGNGLKSVDNQSGQIAPALKKTSTGGGPRRVVPQAGRINPGVKKTSTDAGLRRVAPKAGQIAPAMKNTSTGAGPRRVVPQARLIDQVVKTFTGAGQKRVGPPPGGLQAGIDPAKKKKPMTSGASEANLAKELPVKWVLIMKPVDGRLEFEHSHFDEIDESYIGNQTKTFNLEVPGSKKNIYEVCKRKSNFFFCIFLQFFFSLAMLDICSQNERR